jgi:putative transposase
MSRSSGPTFIAELPLATTARDDRRLGGRVECGKRLNNVLLQEGLALVEAMRADPDWEAAQKIPRSDPEARAAAFQAVRNQYDFNEFHFNRRATYHKKRAGFSGRIGSEEAQNIAKHVYKSLNDWVVGKHGRPRFKGRQRPLHSLEGKRNIGNLMWKADEGVLQIERGWQIKAILPDLKKDEWLAAALQSPVKYCRIVWRQVNGQRRWYLQLVLEGQAPIKASLLERLAEADSEGGLDLGPSTFAWVTENEAGLDTLCAEVKRPHRKVRIIQRQIDRQRRANNPQNYDDKGRVKKGRKRWHVSNRQRQTEVKLQDLQRHEAAVRANAHGRDINRLLSKARHWRDDGVSPKALQRMFGRSVSQRAPGHFMSELGRKAERAGGSRTKIDVRALKNSQYDHSIHTFRKKKLSERWHEFGDGRGRVQRDVYSAFLARNSSGNTYDPARLETAWQALAPVLSEAGVYVQYQGTNNGPAASAASPATVGQSASPAKPKRRGKKHNKAAARKGRSRSRSGPKDAQASREAPATRSGTPLL